ncbi:hypothetical protein DCO58_05825 [Helicobacter saguini]|uniref:Uncharacterized protein n=1 Tax=Helicobacter saguini TaxID=1548018 RepID=A0A347VTD7_9HELI|nr:hypothetical protein [Helicobacter saguini]MWV62135.1 hypothetical protein [Helicobacter saguini]MWV67193.1 hypothetical protein [Helicobacter saguini]MWV69545.1 hypothetical protein [Helicobacter saguini]MWV70904.1 hypothetical protein [Helicobacter saguini]TLD91485.1 hypothetical protein LS64_011895 [Helicobacter saguini]
MKKFFTPKKIILTFIVCAGIYFIGIPLGFVPFWWIQPNYWEFRRLCKINDLPNSEEKYNKILGYFGMKLGDKYVFPKNSSYKYGIELFVYIDFKDKNNEILSMNNIANIDFKPSWIFYYPQIFGHEGNMDFRIDWKTNIHCNNLGKEIMF